MTGAAAGFVAPGDIMGVAARLLSGLAHVFRHEAFSTGYAGWCPLVKSGILDFTLEL
jgi:hypothetical protein